VIFAMMAPACPLPTASGFIIVNVMLFFGIKKIEAAKVGKLNFGFQVTCFVFFWIADNQ